mgnify:CR=1 FL=1
MLINVVKSTLYTPLGGLQHTPRYKHCFVAFFDAQKSPEIALGGFSSNFRSDHLGEIILLRPLFSCQSQVILNLQGVTCLLH